MGGERSFTEPESWETARDQSDPRWLAWLADMTGRIDQFLSDTAPEITEDPWTAEGLDHVESIALQRFPTIESVDLPENRDIADRIHRYIGEVFRRNLEGEWFNVPDFDDQEHSRGFGPVIRLPFNEMYATVVPFLTAAMDRRTGSHWSTILGRQQRRYAEWVEAGRLPLHEWIHARSR